VPNRYRTDVAPLMEVDVDIAAISPDRAREGRAERTASAMDRSVDVEGRSVAGRGLTATGVLP
jgi:hypothetical protein